MQPGEYILCYNRKPETKCYHYGHMAPTEIHLIRIQVEHGLNITQFTGSSNAILSTSVLLS